MQAYQNVNELYRANELDELREKLRELQKDGQTFAAISLEVGVHRSALSQFVNKGLRLKDSQLTALFEYVRASAPADTLEPEHGEVTPCDAPDQEAVTPARHYKTSIELYQTSEYRDTLGWCKYITDKRKMGVMIGYPGSGKTTVLKQFIALTPGASYIECFPTMRMGDMLAAVARAAGVTVSGNNYQKAIQLETELSAREDVTLIFDEAEYLKKWDVDKFEVLRKLWDNTGTPVIFAGTPELERILTRGGGHGNLAQLYRRKYEIKLNGIREKEVLEILHDYNVTVEAANALCKIALDVNHGGMGNFVEVLDMCLEASEGGRIDAGMVSDAKRYKLLY